MPNNKQQHPPHSTESDATTTTTTTRTIINDNQWNDLSENIQYLWCNNSIDILENPPTSLDFSRDYVSKSRPCIIRNVFLDSNSKPTKLTLDDIIAMRTTTTTKTNDNDVSILSSDQQKQKLITVDVTPDGQGDCVRTCRRRRRSRRGTKGQRATNNNNNDCCDHHQQQQEEEEIFIQPKQYQMSLLEFQKRLRNQIIHNEEEEPPQQKTSCSNNSNNNSNSIVDIHGRPILYLPDDDDDDDDDGEVVSESTATTTSADNSNGNSSILPPPPPPPDNSVVYYSKQNDCLRDEFPELQDLFPIEKLNWAQHAFFGNNNTNNNLDAINLWIGNEAVISSMHKDHYENLFYVASGCKVFTILAPACVPFLYEHIKYPIAIFDTIINNNNNGINCDGGDDYDDNDDDTKYIVKQHQQQQWGIRRVFDDDDEGTEERSEQQNGGINKSSVPCPKLVRWVAPDVTCLTSRTTTTTLEEEDEEEHNRRIRLLLLLERYPLLKHVHPITIKVREGELLYLPSLWFHRVTQSCETVGINFWYDMNFDSPLWCYYSFLSQLQPTSSDEK